MKKMINKVTVEGLAYESKLAAKVSKNGKEYIGGELFILTSDDNVVPVSFFEFISTGAHFTSISRGILDLRDIVYFLSVTALFLLFAWQNLEQRRTA